MVGLTPCLQMRTFMIRVTTTYLKRPLNGRNQDSDLHLSEFKVPVVLATLLEIFDLVEAVPVF